MTDKEIEQAVFKSKSLGETLRALYEQEVKFQEKMWAQYLGTIERTFFALQKDGKFYTLDGEREIFDPRYKKYSDYESLSKEEKTYIDGLR